MKAELSDTNGEVSRVVSDTQAAGKYAGHSHVQWSLMIQHNPLYYKSMFPAIKLNGEEDLIWGENQAEEVLMLVLPPSATILASCWLFLVSLYSYEIMIQIFWYKTSWKSKPISSKSNLSGTQFDLKSPTQRLENVLEDISNQESSYSEVISEKDFLQILNWLDLEIYYCVRLKIKDVFQTERKTNPRYLGPYQVKSRIDKGNYLLAELDGTEWTRVIAGFLVIPYIMRRHELIHVLENSTKEPEGTEGSESSETDDNYIRTKDAD